MQLMNTLKYFRDLEAKGYFVLGEPQVQTFYRSSRLHYQVFLNHKNNGVNFIITQGELEQENRLVLALLSDDVNALKPRTYSCSDFVRNNCDNEIFIDQKFADLPDLKNAYVNLFGRSCSETRNLTFYIIQSILKEDKYVNDTSALGDYDEERYSQIEEAALSLLNRSFESLNKPEHVVHLSRLPYLDLEDKLELVSLPYSYLEKSFKPVEPHAWVSTPIFNQDITKPILVRELTPVF